MKITLEIPVVKTIVEKQTITLTEINITRIVDRPNDKIVRAFIRELFEPLILWEGAEYDTAGQWTDVDVQNRIITLLNT